MSGPVNQMKHHIHIRPFTTNLTTVILRQEPATQIGEPISPALRRGPRILRRRIRSRSHQRRLDRFTSQRIQHPIDPPRPVRRLGQLQPAANEPGVVTATTTRANNDASTSHPQTSRPSVYRPTPPCPPDDEPRSHRHPSQPFQTRPTTGRTPRPRLSSCPPTPRPYTHPTTSIRTYVRL